MYTVLVEFETAQTMGKPEPPVGVLTARIETATKEALEEAGIDVMRITRIEVSR